MKILYFVHTYGEKNGIAVHVGNLARSLPDGMDAKIISGKGRGIPLFSSLRMPVAEIFDALGSEFDVVHIHGYGNFFSFFGAIVAAIRKKPLVWTIHGYPKIHGMRRFFYYVYRHLMAPIIFAKASGIISVSSDILPLLAKETEKRILVLPNGIDLELFRAKKNYRSAKMACFVGRLDPDKGVRRMLEVSSLPLLFIGPDEDGTRAKLACEAKEAGRAAHFAEAGFEKMPGEYEKCRYVVLPSKYEGFPLTLLESVAMERPFISTDVGEVKATLSNLFEKPGKFLLDGSLQEKINELEKTDLGEELESARKNVAAYSWKSVAGKVALVYSEVARKG